MRASRTLLAVSIAAAALASTVFADTTKTLRIEYSPTGPFAVENMAGSMRILAGTTDKVVVVATVHADDEATADLMKLEQVSGDKNVPTLRMIYPIDKFTTFRYPTEAQENLHWLERLFGFDNSTTTKYDGHRVTIRSGSGVLLYADIAIELPRHSVEATFKNLVGAMSGEGVEGTLKFDSASGDVTLENLKGEITADTGSGDVKADTLSGSYICDTGSGDCTLNGFTGEKVACNVGSGDIQIHSGTAHFMDMSTGSGDIEVTDFDIEEFKADTGSGDVLVAVRGDRLAKFKADTGSGDVTLRMDANASFEARCDISSGDVISHYRDAEPIIKDREVVGFRRGSAKTRIDVDTGSGDFTIEPLS